LDKTLDSFYAPNAVSSVGLPGWIAFANAWSLFAVAAAASFVAMFVACVVTFPRLSSSQAMHWTEVARRVDPLRRTGQIAMALFPILFGAIGVMNSGPLSPLPSWFMAFVGSAGAAFGILPVYYHVHRNVGLPVGGLKHEIHSLLAKLLFVAPHLVLCGLLVLLLTSRVIENIFILSGLAAFGTLCIVFGAELRLARLLGTLNAAPDHLRIQAEKAARKLGVPFPRVYLVPIRFANAYAWPHLHSVAMTQAAAERLTPDEIEVVFAHEIGHISEPLHRRLARLGMLAMPQFVVVAIFFLMSQGYSLLVSLTAASVLLTLFGAQVGRHLTGAEENADSVARSVDGNRFVYASALEKLHRHNLIPAVTGQKIKGHPDLYDRLVAAGAEPEFPRPLAPVRGRGETAVILAMFIAFMGAVLLKTGPFMAVVAPSSDSINTWLSVGIDGGASALGLMKVAEGEHRRGAFDSSRLLYRHAAKSHPAPGIFYNWALSSAAAGDCIEARQAVAAAKAVTDPASSASGSHLNDSEIAAFVEACVPHTATAH